MSSTEALETPREKRSLSSRLRAHARKAAIPALLLSVTVGGLSTTAQAADGPQCPPNNGASTCSAAGAPWRGAQPNDPNITDQMWRGAVTSADFWNTHDLDRSDHISLIAQGSWGYHAGWPGDTNARGWHSFRTGTWRNRTTWWIYYGGVFQDRDGRIANYEASFGVSSWDRDGANQVYREYDVDAHTTTDSGIRGKVRIVRNMHTGHVYVTFDHYNTFHYLGRW